MSQKHSPEIGTGSPFFPAYIIAAAVAVAVAALHPA